MDPSPNPLPRRYATTVLLVLTLAIASGVLFRLSSAALPAPDADGDPPRGLAVSSISASPAGSRDRPAKYPAPTPTLPAADAFSAAMARPARLQAKIEIVWPHDNAPVREANLANITVFLLTDKGKESVPCAAEYTVRLWRAVNADAARPIALGQKRMFSAGGHSFPAWDFNDVDVSAGRDPANRLVFFATVDGIATRRNIWVHAADARTMFPQADLPKQARSGRPALVEARIEILWPQENLPLTQAGRANISAYLFDAMTGQALAPDPGSWRPTVQLHWAKNSDADRGAGSSAIGKEHRVAGANGVIFSAWDFNDIDISAAQDTLNKIHYWVDVEDLPTLPNVWTHGAAAPTLYPRTDLPASCE
ncbi:MAG TPA: hypothetical protein VGA61_21375 [Anaerolineae bacterium]